MNPSEETAPTAAPDTPGPKKRRWRLAGIVLLAIAAVVLFIKLLPETPQHRIEREVRNILAPVRKNDPSGFNLQKVADTLENWPKPFPKLAELISSPDNSTGSEASDLAQFGQPVVPILTNLLAYDRSPAVRSTVAEALGEMSDPRLDALLMAVFPKENNPGVQSAIISALGRSENEKSVPFLISVLQSTNRQVMQNAVRALESFNSPEALATISNILVHSPDVTLRQAAASSAYRPEMVPEIRSALLFALKSDSDQSVRQSAANALAMDMEDETTLALVAVFEEDSVPAREVQKAAIYALRSRTNAIIRPALLKALRSNTPGVRGSVVDVLANFPGPETETNLQPLLLSDADPIVRAAAARGLGQLAITQTNRTFVAALANALENDGEPAVRAAAASALSRIEGKDVIQALQTALEKERKDEVQVQAIGGVARDRTPETASLLLTMLDNPNCGPQARAAVVRNLGYTRAPAALPRLLVLTADSEPEVRTAAIYGLTSFDTTNSVATLIDVLRKGPDDVSRSTAATVLGGLRSAQTASVVSALTVAMQTETNAAVLAAAVKSLGELRDPRVLDDLVKALRFDRDNDVRTHAAEALGKLGSLKAVPALESAYHKDRNREVRSQALESLATLTGTTRADFFIKAFQEDPVMRAKLASILGRIGSPEAAAVLLKALQEEGWVDRRSAVSALGEMGDARAVPPVIDVLKKDRDGATRAAASTALGQLGSSDAVPALEAALEDRIQSIRQEAAWALGHIGDARATSALSKALNDRASEVRFAAAFALAEIGDRNVAPALEPLLQHSEERTRLAAASALAFLGDSHGLSVLDSTLRSHDTWQRFTALISLLRLNTPEARKLLTDCHDQDATLMVAIEAGLRVGGAGAATNMLSVARHSDSMTEDYRHFGARSLIFFSDPATLPVLEANANDSQDDVRAAARIAIHRIKKKMKAGEQAAAKPGN